MVETIQIESLTTWSVPRRVETKNGPRMLRTGVAGDLFWAAWRSDKDTLKVAGVSCGRNRNGDWEACWWLPLPKEEAEKVEAAMEASRATDAAVEIPCPEGLAYLPYQKAGIAYAMGRKATLIGDEMGLGKTIQAIGLINADTNINKVLVVCPATLRLNWRRELEKWLVRKLSIAVVDGGKPNDWRDADITIVNYDVVKKHRAQIDAAGTYDLVILDEAHYLKNSKAARTQSIYGKDGVGAIAARQVVAMTGTPICNRPIELFSFLAYADRDGLGKNFFAYGKKFCDAKNNGYGWDFSGASNLDQLQRQLRERLMVRRLKSEVLTELPAKRRQVIELPANGAASAVVEEEQAAIAAREEVTLALQTAVELAKASDDPVEYATAIANLQEGQSEVFSEISRARHAVALAKVPYVIEHLENALENGPVVLFAHHKDVVDELAKAFAGRCVTLTGGTAMEDRQKAVDDFQSGKVDLFIGNILAAGVGITLVRSSHVVFAELDWVPGNMTQAEDRCHRIGQSNCVLVQHLVLEGSLDAHLARVLISKQDVIDRALDRQVKQEEGFAVLSKERPTTVAITVDEVRKQGDEMTAEQVDAVHQALRRVAGVCDGARELDGCGFNKFDAGIGRSLAMQETLTNRQAALGRKLVKKYVRQIGAELVARMG